MIPATIAGLIRHALTFGGGFLVSADYIPQTELDGVVAAVMTLVGIAWSAFHKKKVSE